VESSDRHQYRLNPPLTEAQVGAVEARIGCPLPEQFRRFVTELADGGAGPAYGITSIADLDGDRTTPFVPPTSVARMKRVTFDGAIEICEIGCGNGYYLIVSGPDAGVVWYSGDRARVPAQADGSWSDGAAMLASPRSARAEFIDWYVHWLDEALWEIARSTPDAAPGYEIDVSLEMTATETGLQRSSWQLANGDGDRFGDEFFAEVVAERT
jgi:hypothetical protein